ncbi:MAG: 2-oxoacid:acceptor oxidoreductase family protein [Caldiserica bacterium]|jgi:2-oxoglutarate ferredoxin oxidoreductase subunit gamma|nr:2-oxoacid:acceptor oxidoreductase family protein [Caldisericota bacterium]MDH7562924.1 2-oxoacid:acceptor oxidoreductase family protein [Caldisericota bacterium]
MVFELVCAGFGGQGVMLMGQLLAYAAALEGKEATWFPSYGPEMRGGTANCQVVISDEPITSPILSRPQTAIVLNKPSFFKFEPLVAPGGFLFVNTSLVDIPSQRGDIDILLIPATEIAQEIGSTQVANLVLLGAYVEKLKPVDFSSIEKILEKFMTGAKAKFLPLNKEALKRGRELVKRN